MLGSLKNLNQTQPSKVEAPLQRDVVHFGGNHIHSNKLFGENSVVKPENTKISGKKLNLLA